MIPIFLCDGAVLERNERIFLWFTSAWEEAAGRKAKSKTKVRRIKIFLLEFVIAAFF